MMSNERWTAGPWSVDASGQSFIITGDGGHYDVAVVRNIGNHDNLANANLIAAAPELYEALKVFADCCEYIESDEDGEEWAKFRLLIKNYRAAKAACDKARGES